MDMGIDMSDMDLMDMDVVNTKTNTKKKTQTQTQTQTQCLEDPIHYGEVSIGGVTFRILTFGQLGRKYHFHSLF